LSESRTELEPLSLVTGIKYATHSALNMLKACTTPPCVSMKGRAIDGIPNLRAQAC
jgi:hypothetical protein